MLWVKRSPTKAYNARRVVTLGGHVANLNKLFLSSRNREEARRDSSIFDLRVRTYVHAELKYVYPASRVHHAQTKFKFKERMELSCFGAFSGPVLAFIRVL